MSPPAVEGPYFEDLAAGQVYAGAPGLTLSPGLAAAHQAISGNRLPLTLDVPLCEAVTRGPQLVSPSLAWDVAIGQSTVVTRHVKANLFYRGLAFRRLPRVGDTLRTTTRVGGLRQNKPRAGRTPTGLAALRITTVDQEDRPVLDFWRCAMLPLRDPDRQTGHADGLDEIGAPLSAAGLAGLAAGWRLDRLARQAGGSMLRRLAVGQTLEVTGGDVVTCAPELARLTLNIAAVHHDGAAAGGQRLVYGGHVIGLALTQAARAIPTIATVAGWHGCDHLGPVHEGDTVRSTITVEQIEPLPFAGGLVHLRSMVRADSDGPEPRPVLDWRYVAIVA
jgi:acyl dehydratase